MARTKRIRSDSLAAQAMVAEYPAWPSKVPVPEGREDEVKETYRDVLETRAGSDWSSAGALLAAEFATVTARIAIVNERLDREGAVIETLSASGVLVLKENPSCNVLMKLSNRQIALARSLGFSGLPTSQGARQGVIAHGQKITSRHPDDVSDTFDGEAIDWAAEAGIK